MAEKSIAKNSIFNVLYRLMNMVFPLVTSVYISHILMADGVGRVSYAQNIVQYFVLLAPLGITNYGTREIAKMRTQKVASDKLFSELFLINLSSTVLCSVAFYGIVLVSDWFANDRALFLVAGIQILLNAINVEWYYQGQEEYVYIAVRSMMVKAASLVAMLIFVRTAEDYVIYALIYILGFAGNYIFNVYNLWRKGVRINFSKLSFKTHFKPILILFSSNIAVELYVLLGTTMLGVFCEDEIVGYYNNAVKLVKIIVGLITAIGCVLLPRLSHYKNLGRMDECNMLISRVTMVMFLFSVPCGIGVAILAENLVYVMFGASFLPAVITVQIASVLVYVLGFSNLFGTQVLLTFNQEKKLLLCTIAGALSNIALNILLIPKYQHNGAAVATVISETIVTIMTAAMSHKYIKLQISGSFWVKTLIAGAAMGIVVFLMNSVISSPMLNVLVSVMLGAVVYFVLGILLRNPFLSQVKQLIRKK